MTLVDPDGLSDWHEIKVFFLKIFECYAAEVQNQNGQKMNKFLYERGNMCISYADQITLSIVQVLYAWNLFPYTFIENGVAKKK